MYSAVPNIWAIEEYLRPWALTPFSSRGPGVSVERWGRGLAWSSKEPFCVFRNYCRPALYIHRGLDWPTDPGDRWEQGQRQGGIENCW